MAARITSWRDVQARLDRLGMFHMKLGLERMERGLRALDLASPPYVAAQIVGTNGKGSTSAFLASLGLNAGVKTGLFTSPHMLSPRERIRINGATLAEERWVELARRVFSIGEECTWFESVCLMAALAFSEEQVEFAVMEAGLGGRSDATTALPAALVCFTPIGHDHMDILGADLRDIVQDKAAAMRPGVPAISAPQKPEAYALLLEKARSLNIPLLQAEDALPADWKLGLQGAHQTENAALALAAWMELARRRGWPIRERGLRPGLANAFIAGRLQRIPAGGTLPDMLLDGAHNAHAFAALKRALAELDIRPRAVIFSCLADKKLDGIAPLLLDLARGAPLLVPPIAANSRAAPPDRIAAELKGAAAVMPDLRAALEAAAGLNPSPQAPVLLCGSLYLLAEFFSLYPKHLDGHQ